VLRILAGYLRPSAGSAQVAGLDVVADSLAARRRVGYVPEDAPLYRGMGVREFLEFMGRLKGLRGPSLPTAVETTLQRLALEGVQRAQIGTLSRGYRQRVAIAQALLGEPDLLILDEPTNGLDPRQIIEMRGLVRSLSGDRTILVTSHILGEIEQVADRVAILAQGRLLGTHTLRSADGVRWRVRVKGDRAQVLARLRHVAGVDLVEEVPEPASSSIAAYLVVSQSAEVAEAVAAAVVGAGFGLLALEPAPPELEALFLRLTAGPPGALA
jgi:gliding motility-associated transport system ATP-binding protein